MFNYIKKKYDTHVLKLCNKLMVTQCKINKKSLCIEMLKQCILKIVVFYSGLEIRIA